MKRYIVSTIVVAAALLQSAAFANVLNGGDIGTAGNWDDGLLPTTANGNTPGVINSSNTGANQGTINGTYDDLVVSQTGGDVARTGFGNSIFNNVNWAITGGTFASTILGHQMNDSILDIKGGTLSFASLTARSSSVTMTNGTLTTNNDMQSQGGTVFDFSGGTVSVGRDAMVGFQPTTTYNLSGNVAFSVTRNMGEIDAGVRTINIGLGTGSASVGGNLEFDGLTMDWTSGSDFSFTAAAVLDNGATTTWEAMWNLGQLTRDGTNSTTFAQDFDVAGNTLTVVPEPATLGLIATAGALLMVLRRRVKK
jgi:hypothetical protein